MGGRQGPSPPSLCTPGSSAVTRRRQPRARTRKRRCARSRNATPDTDVPVACDFPDMKYNSLDFSPTVYKCKAHRWLRGSGWWADWALAALCPPCPDDPAPMNTRSTGTAGKEGQQGTPRTAKEAGESPEGSTDATFKVRQNTPLATAVRQRRPFREFRPSRRGA